MESIVRKSGQREKGDIDAENVVPSITSLARVKQPLFNKLSKTNESSYGRKSLIRFAHGVVNH